MSLKRIVGGGIILLLLIGVLSGCGKTKADISDNNNTGQISSSQADSDTSGIKKAGESSYDVPDGWEIAEEMSTDDKKFYVEEGKSSVRQPDNFSVEYRTNRYDAADHEAFRDAIVQQLGLQAAQRDATLESSGHTTDEGDVYYKFTLDYGEGVATQFYIVGEQKYCLVYATDFSGESIAADAALAVTKSFRW